jgi:hypothetical protein
MFQMMDPAGETDKAVTYQNIRLMQVANSFASSEQEEVSGIWIPWSATTSRMYCLFDISITDSGQ